MRQFKTSYYKEISAYQKDFGFGGFVGYGGSLAAVVADDLVDFYDDVLGDAGLYGSAIDHLGEK